MSEQKDLFVSKMNSLADSINAKAKTTGKKNLDELKTLVDGFKGGATITTPGGWVGTPVPNTGTVENVYINTSLSVEEVISLISQLTYSEDGRYIVLVDSGNTKAIAILGMDGIYAIQVDGAFLFSNTEELGFVGWNTDLVNPYTFGLEATSVLGTFEVGSQNELLSSLFSTTPFTQSEGETLTIEGDYDGSTLVLDELPKDGWSGTAVPNTGTVESVYFNTALSKEEIIELIKPLDYVQGEGYNYFLFNKSDSTDYTIIAIDNTENPTMVLIYRFNNSNIEMIYDSDNAMEMGVTGWNSDVIYPLELNYEVISTYNDISVGLQNDLLTNLFSTTPFVETKANTIDVKALIEQKKIPLEIKVNVDPFNNLEFEKTTVETFTGSTIETFNYQFDNSKNFNDFIQLLTSGNTINGLLPIMVLGFPDSESCYFLENPGQSSQDGVLNVLIYDIVSMSVNFKFGVGDTNIYLFDVTAEGTSILTDIVSGLSSLKIKYLK